LDNLNERDHLGETGMERRIILKWNIKKQDLREWTTFIWLRIETDQQWAVLNMVLNLQAPQMAGN
jgi:hypothetical protein